MHARVCACMCSFPFQRERERVREKERESFSPFFFKGMSAETCGPYSDMTSMDAFYSPSAVQTRDQQTEHFRTFPSPDTKYSPAAFVQAHKGHAYGDKPRSPFQQEGRSLDAVSAADHAAFSKFHLFTYRSSCRTPPEEEGERHREGGHDAAILPCYGE